MKPQSPPDLDLYGFYGSFCTQKVKLALAEKGVEAAYKSVNIGPPMENYEPWYARLNPRMVVPTLRHQGRLVCDSSRIIRYIDAQFPGPSLVPADPGRNEQMQAIVEAIDALPIRELSYSRMRGALRQFRDRVLMPRRLRLLRRGRGKAPELADLYDARIADVEAWVVAMHKPSKRAEANTQLMATLSDLEARLSQQQSSEFLVGNAYSLADLMATVLYARVRAMTLADLAPYPLLASHYARMRLRPNFPQDEIVEAFEFRRLFPIIAPFVLPRLALVVAVLGLLAWGLLAMLGNGAAPT